MVENRTLHGGREQGDRWKGCGWNLQGRSGRGGRGRRDRRPPNVARFTGASSKMLGHVFQVNGKQRKRGQFKESVDMLNVYVSENFKKDVRAMESLFGDEIKSRK